MSIENTIKIAIKNIILLSGPERDIWKVIRGEFNRVNDGKPVDDETAVKIIKKMIISNENTIKLLNNKDEEKIKNLELELSIYRYILPKENPIAGEKMMKIVIKEILSKNSFKNPIQSMGLCINFLKERNYNVDNKHLSALLKNINIE